VPKSDYSDIVEYIMENVDLLETIESYGLKPHFETDGRHTMMCPFHTENTASLKIYEGKSFFCFGCSAGYSVIDFIKMYEDIGFMEVIDRYRAKVDGPNGEDIFQKIVNQSRNTEFDLSGHMFTSKYRLGITLREYLIEHPESLEFVDRCFYDMDNFFEDVRNLNKEKIEYFEEGIIERIADEKG
jgi:hypothetical protein